MKDGFFNIIKIKKRVKILVLFNFKKLKIYTLSLLKFKTTKDHSTLIN